MSNARLSEADLMREAKVILMGGQAHREPKKLAPSLAPPPLNFPETVLDGATMANVPRAPDEKSGERSGELQKTTEKIGRAARAMTALAQRLRDTEIYIEALQSQLKSERARSAKLQDELDTLRVSSQTELRSAETVFRDAVKQLQEKNHSLAERCDVLQRELSGKDHSVEGYRTVLKSLLAENDVTTPIDDQGRKGPSGS